MRGNSSISTHRDWPSTRSLPRRVTTVALPEPTGAFGAPRPHLTIILCSSKHFPISSLRTIFEQDSQDEVEKRKSASKLPLERDQKKPIPSFWQTVIDIPKRPPWDYAMSKEQVEGQEKEMFDVYLKNISLTYSGRINYFEQNLEVWRQLWRVCEISDVLCILADVRYPLFHFPPSLYHYVVEVFKKPLILVLTKMDLVPAENVHMWVAWFRQHFPSLYVTPFASYLKKDSEEILAHLGKKKRKTALGAKTKFFPTGATPFLELVQSLGIKKNGKNVNITYRPPNEQDLPEELIAGGRHQASSSSHIHSSSVKTEPVESDDEDKDGEKDEVDDTLLEREAAEQAKEDDHYAPIKETDHLIIGTIGNPNVGKSTFINALKGRKVCSTSRTPGHTKWKQTIFLDSNLMVCDCPGLVFPAVDMPKPLQILCGIFPIAQVREPYSAIQFLAERVPVERIYSLTVPASVQGAAKTKFQWSAFAITEAYAEKRGYFTKHGNPDTHRAGLEILFDVIDGRIVMYFLPNQLQVNLNVYHTPLAQLLSDGEAASPATGAMPKKKSLLAGEFDSDDEAPLPDDVDDDDDDLSEDGEFDSEEDDEEDDDVQSGDDPDDDDDDSIMPSVANPFAALDS
jgi:ribosome biogenesis GTPase A